jgi:hypothetical protein
VITFQKVITSKFVNQKLESRQKVGKGCLGKPLGSRTNRNNIIVLLASSVTCLGVQTSLASTCATQTHGKCVTLVISISRAAVAKGLIVGWERRSNCGCTLTRSRECLITKHSYLCTSKSGEMRAMHHQPPQLARPRTTPATHTYSPSRPLSLTHTCTPAPNYTEGPNHVFLAHDTHKASPNGKRTLLMYSIPCPPFDHPFTKGAPGAPPDHHRSDPPAELSCCQRAA